jgi:hypothetical protein
MFAAPAGAASKGPRRPIVPAHAAGTPSVDATADASADAAARPRVSPYAIAARQHAQAAPGPGHLAAVPPSMRRTRMAVSRVPPQ